MYSGGWEAKNKEWLTRRARKCPRAGLKCPPNHDGQGEDLIEECSGQISPELIEISLEPTWSYLEQYQFAKS